MSIPKHMALGVAGYYLKQMWSSLERHKEYAELWPVISDSPNIGVALVVEGVACWVNARFAELLNISERELLGQPISTVLGVQEVYSPIYLCNKLDSNLKEQKLLLVWNDYPLLHDGIKSLRIATLSTISERSDRPGIEGLHRANPAISKNSYKIEPNESTPKISVYA